MTNAISLRAAVWGAAFMFLPALFVFSALTKYVLGFSPLFDAVSPLFTMIDQVRIAGISLTPVIFLGGLLTAVLLNASAVFQVKAKGTAKRIIVELSIRKNLRNIAVLFASVAVLGVLAAYVFLENWACIIGTAFSC